MSLLTNVLKLWRTGQYLLPADSGFMVKHLFANGEPGFAKLDFSGFAGMYQDRARTIPYTAVEQPLGSFTGLNGVTATAPADVNRGVVSARVNFCTDTEAFNAWNADTATVDSNVAISPIGTLTADRINVSAAPSSGVYKNLITVAASHEMSVWVRSEAGTRTFRLFSYNATDVSITSPDFVATTTWQKFTVTIPRTVSISSWHIANAASGPTAGALLVWGASVVLSTDSHLPYQRVNTATDYDTAGFPHYLKFNGTNTTYVTPSIDFTGTDKMTVWAGITKIGDATRNPIIEVAGYGVAKGFGLYSSPDTLPNQIQAFHAGATCAYVYAAGMPPGGNYRLSMVSDLASPYLNLRKDGVQVAQSLTNVGGGAYGNLPMSIGTGSSSRYFNGRLYSLIVRGAATPLPHIEVVETLIRKTMRLP